MSSNTTSIVCRLLGGSGRTQHCPAPTKKLPALCAAANAPAFVAVPAVRPTLPLAA